MIKKEFHYPSADGKTSIHAIRWIPEGKVRGVLQLSHGVAEYVNRYDHFAAWLCSQGFVVTGNDHLGHGSSIAPGVRPLYFGPKGSWDFVVRDIYALFDSTKKKFPDVPYFLLGHSMGSFLARTYLIRYPGTMDGAIIVGTGQMSPALVRAGRLIAAIYGRQTGWDKPNLMVDRLAFGSYNVTFAPNRTTHDWVSLDENNVDAYLADSLCGGKPSIGLFREMLGGIAFITKQSNVEKMNSGTPILFLSGAMDPVGDCGKGVEKAYESFRKAGVKDVERKLYPELRHEVLNEACREEVYGDILHWLESRMKTR